MAAKNTVTGLVGLILVATSLLFLFFIILSGVSDVTPFDKTYFLQADTSGISGARPTTQWNYFYICGEGNNDCSGAAAARPFGDDVWDSNPTGAPGSLTGSHGDDTTSYKFYYLWRFGWVFFLMALLFDALALFAGFIACCGRLGAAVASFITFVALFFSTLAVVLMTVTFVEARNRFQDNDRDASLGRYAFGFAWANVACLFIATILFCIGIRKGKNTKRVSRTSSMSPAGTRRRGRFGLPAFGRGKSVRSYEGRRVKDDYA